ncbi:MAG: hypothetical protein U0136_21250 [Bdellovibrionota bacterium]
MFCVWDLLFPNGVSPDKGLCERSEYSDAHNERGSFIVEFALGSSIYFGLLIFFSWAIYFVFEQTALQYSIDKVLRDVAINGMDSTLTPAQQTDQVKTLISNAAHGYHIDTNDIVVSMEWCDPLVASVNCQGAGWAAGAGGVNHWVRVNVSANRTLPFIHLTVPVHTGVLVRNELRPGA